MADTYSDDFDSSDSDDSISSDSPSLGLPAQISALLFIATAPLSIEDIARVTGSTHDAVQDALSRVQEFYIDSVHGFSLVDVNGGYQLRTASAALSVISKFRPPKAKRLSRAAAETLAVVAYKQPVHRAEIESIRGVDALPTLKTLLDSKLIRIVGKEDSVGHPALYGTTPRFLEIFGLRDLSDLPSMRDLQQFAKEPGDASITGDCEGNACDSSVDDTTNCVADVDFVENIECAQSVV